MNFNQNYTKTKNRLYTAGQGIILFTIWDVIQAIMTFLMEKTELFANAGLNSTDSLTQTLAVILAFIILGVIFMSHLYVGRKAISFAKEKHHNLFFIFFDIIMIFCSIGLILLTPIDLNTFNLDTFKNIVELLINVTEIIILLEIVIYAIQFKSLQKGDK